MHDYTNTLAPGTRLTSSSGIFEIVEVLGQGGFGITYKAELLLKGSLGAMRSGAFFAIKEFFLSEHNLRRGDTVTGVETKFFQKYLKKFERESRLLAELDHPGICHVQDAFSANGTAYYVMDFYPGGSLGDLIRRSAGGAMTEAEATRYLRRIASALEYLHRKGMAHLDLKPQNVMLKAGGEPVLIDFGISKQFDDDGQFRSTDSMGGCTPGYAPLEQANYVAGTGDPHLMDIYALGATFYKMLTGQTPPKAADVLNTGVPLGPLRDRGVSEVAIAVIVKAMQPVKRDRFQSVAEMMGCLTGETAPEKDEEISVVAVEKPEEKKAERSGNNGGDGNNEPPEIDDPEEEPESTSSNRRPILIAACVALAVLLGFWLIPKGSEEPVIDPEVVVVDTLAATETMPVAMETEAPAPQTPAPQSPSTDDLAAKRHRDEEARKQREEEERLQAQQKQREEEARKQREEEERRQAELNKTFGHSIPAAFELCTKRDGKVFYFSQSEWKSVPSHVKSKYSKKGVYVPNGSRPFLVELHHSGNEMKWDEAMSRYGNRLPSKEQGEAMLYDPKTLKNAIIAFGGDMNPRLARLDYWTRTEIDSSGAWTVDMDNGGFIPTSKSYAARVCCVAPVPSSAR